MNVLLAPEDQRIVEQQLSAGRFQSVEEIVHAALSLLEHQHTDGVAHAGSCYDVLEQAGAIGMITDGAVDVSTNPKYMKGFGDS